MVLYRCSLTYRSGRKAGRGSHASGEAEWSERGVGNLTRAAYATQRMTLHVKSPISKLKSGIRGLRYVVIHVACLLIMFFNGRLAMPT